jgi:hypothetical protein
VKLSARCAMRDAARAYLRHETDVARAVVDIERRETVVHVAALVNTSEREVGSRLSGVVLETGSKVRDVNALFRGDRTRVHAKTTLLNACMHGFQTFFEHHYILPNLSYVPGCTSDPLRHCSSFR